MHDAFKPWPIGSRQRLPPNYTLPAPVPTTVLRWPLSIGRLDWGWPSPAGKPGSSLIRTAVNKTALWPSHRRRSPSRSCPIHLGNGLNVTDARVIGHQSTFEDVLIGPGRVLLLYLLAEIHQDLGRLIDGRLTAGSPEHLMKALVHLHDAKAVAMVPCAIGGEGIT